MYDIKGQKPINSGKPNPQFTASGQEINFDSNGFPDFTDHVHSIGGKKQYYEIDMQGNYEGVNSDFGISDSKAGISKKYRDDNGLTWHHHQDGKTMMLVPKDINGGIRHTGGKAITEHNIDFPNNVLYFPSPIIN